MSQTVRTEVTTIAGVRSVHEDVVVVEEPLEIRVNERAISVTLRTPGDDFALAAGFLFTESVIHDAADVESIRHWGSSNVVRVALREGVRVDWGRLQRNFYSTSSCGVCGKASIDAVQVCAAPLTTTIRVRREVIERLPELLRAQQKAFDATGGIHAAGLFAADGTLLRIAEDVGRHNAVDKAIGASFLEKRALDEHILFVSGRTSFEILQKAAVARIPVVAAVGAPSSLAVELARTLGITLLGFVRQGRFNVYSGDGAIEG